MKFSAKYSIDHFGFPDNILHKPHISSVTEACVSTMQSSQYTGEGWRVYLKYITHHLHHFGTIKVDQVE